MGSDWSCVCEGTIAFVGLRGDSSMEVKALNLHGLGPEAALDGAGTWALEDVWLPSGEGARVRIRTLIYDLEAQRREAWLACALRPQLGAECASDPIFLGRQCHGTCVRDVDREKAIAVGDRYEYPLCDGLMTQQRGTVLAVRTADCVPVVVSDAARPWVGAVHSGWRGTLEGILGVLISGAIRGGSRPSDLHLWIGPHIHACHYEIGEQLSHRFADAFPERGVLRGQRHLSLLDCNIAQAVAAGVPETQIRSSALCTFEECNSLPSYRRDGSCRGEIVTSAVIVIDG